ncbi:DUF6221 family protein [Streptomyces caniscabiei]|uniref:DUF6221 family protein n=1 Tax=Streptomyces caniscabiei TaxID=2746961 RepID=UPI0018722878|nr:DUF6221 family protein [Streptomyces caniscabiei]MBE4796151.1 hypothetical protein [Streptomyces caniscabiei]MDX2944458.1 DUF6221 family protein [Streptomyces caniscabiei]
MEDLVRWLNTQLDTDAEKARAATPGPWTVDSESHAEAIRSASGTDVVAGGRWGGEASVFESDEDAAHIAAWDPARVLREVDSKRRVLGAIEHLLGQVDDPFAGVDGVLRLLAVPYADRPGYREEWRP